MYLQSRAGKAQFWGGMKPDPNLNCIENGCMLVSNEVRKSQNRYRALQSTSSAHGKWWDRITERHGAKDFPNFEVFHKIRKSIRTVLNTHRVLDSVSPSLFLPLSPHVLQWLHKYSEHKVRIVCRGSVSA